MNAGFLQRTKPGIGRTLVRPPAATYAILGRQARANLLGSRSWGKGLGGDPGRGQAGAILGGDGWGDPGAGMAGDDAAACAKRPKRPYCWPWVLPAAFRLAQAKQPGKRLSVRGE